MSTGVVLTVSALNRYIKSVFEMDANLQTVYLKGEISNFKNHYSTGHLYMTIKDEQSQLKAVMFKSAAQRLRFMPEDSMSVIIRGRISVYEKTGEYQIYIDDMQPDGTGALAIAFEQLKKKLEAEGLFNPEHKKLIPEYPERVGIVTSETGAAVRDIINVINRRYPLAEIILYPVLVQGTGASSQIATAIRYFNENRNADVLIVGRGGGSIEDLWAFNEEIVVRAVYNSSIPLISAVGHETDFTLSDFAADLRAPTPSAAAELAVPDIADIKNTLLSYCKRLSVCSNSKLNSLESALEKNGLLLQKHSPKIIVENYLLRIDSLNSDIETKVKHKLEYCSMSLSDNAARLEALNPLKILARGYSAAIKNNVTVRSKTQFEIGDCFDLLLSDGKVKCEVIDNGEN